MDGLFRSDNKAKLSSNATELGNRFGYARAGFSPFPLVEVFSWGICQGWPKRNEQEDIKKNIISTIYFLNVFTFLH